MTAPLAAPPSLAARLRSVSAVPVLVVAAAAIAGFVLIGQLQGDRPRANPLQAESEGDLARILAGLNAQGDALQAELADLKVQINELRRSSESEVASAEALQQQLRSLEVLAGTIAVTGPGVVVTITDTGGSLAYDGMLDMIQELRDAGAEAIAVNDARIGVSTAFAERDGRIVVDGTTITAPYRVRAIGQSSTLEGGLKIPGGAVDSISALKGVRVDVQKQARVDLPALARVPTFDVARPVPAS